MKFRNLPALLQAYLVVTCIAGGASLFLLPRFAAPNDWVMVLGLAAATLLFSIWKVDLSGRQSQLTLASAVVCLAALMQGGYAAVVCAATGALAGTLIRQTEGSRLPTFAWSWSRRSFDISRPFFNASICVLAAILATFALMAASTWVEQTFGVKGGARAVVASAAGSMVFQTVYFVVNTLGVAGFLALNARKSLHTIWTESFAWTWPGYLASAALAVGIYIASQLFALGIVSVLFLAPLYWIYVSYRLYSDRMNLMVGRMEQEMRHIRDLNDLNGSIISSLAAAIDAKDRHTRSHISRVQMYAMALADRAGLEGPLLEAVRIGALVHDIGKLGIPERILCKPGKLTPEEFRWMQAHVTIGVDILEPVPFPYPVKDIVLTHHERWDGLGYPNGLKGTAIPIGGRIMAIADVFDALTSSRPYRRALSVEAALKFIQEGSRKQFDPHLVELFAEVLPEVHERVLALTEAEPPTMQESGPAPASVREATPEERLARTRTEASASAELASALATTETVADVLDVLSRQAQRLFPVDTVAVFLCRPDGTLRAELVRGQYEVKLAGLSMARGEGVSGWVAESLQAKINAQASLDIARRFTPDEMMELSAATAVPLVAGHATLGVLTLYTTAYSVLNEEHASLLSLLGDHAAQALLNARSFEETQELSVEDPLTNLANSRSLMRQLEALAAQGDAPFAVAMFDLDDFRTLNHTLGHLGGDTLLTHLGTVLRTSCSETETPYRYAADCFAVIIRGQDEAGVRERTQELCDLLERGATEFIGQPVSLTCGSRCAVLGKSGTLDLLADAERTLQQSRLERPGLVAKVG